MIVKPVAVLQVAQRTTLENLADISTIIIALAILALLGALIFAVLEVRKGQKKVMAFIDGLRSDLAPAIDNVKAISSEMVGVSNVVSSRARAVDETLDQANERLRDSVELAYRRVRHFDALLEVAQEEAEGFFVNAASAVRGVKRGAEAIAGRGKAARRARRRRERYLESEEADAYPEYSGNGSNETADDDDQLWDDDFERVIDVEDASDPAHPLTSTEQGPTIHRRRPRSGPR